MTNRERTRTINESRNIHEEASDFRDVDFLLTLIDFESRGLLDQEQSKQLIELSHSAEFLKGGFRGLIQFTKKRSLLPKNSIPSIFEQIKEQIQFQDRVAKLSYEIDATRQLFSVKSIGLLKLSSFGHGLSKNSFGIPQKDIGEIEITLSYYKKLYTFYRNVEKNEFIIGTDLSDKVLGHLEKIFAEPNLDKNIIDRYEKLLLSIENLKRDVRKNIDKYSEVGGGWFFSQNHKKNEAPFKDFLDMFSLYATRYTYGSDISQFSSSFFTKTQIEDIISQMYNDNPTLFQGRNLGNLIFSASTKEKIVLGSLIGGISQQKKKEEIIKESGISVSAHNQSEVAFERQKQLFDELLSHSEFPRVLSFKHDKKNLSKNLNQERDIGSIVSDFTGYKESFGEVFEFLKQNIPSGSKKGFEIVKNFYQKGMLTVAQSYEIMEGKSGLQRGGVTLTEMLQTFGLHPRFKDSFESIFRVKLTKSIEENLKKLLAYFLYMESSGGYNVLNYTGESSAEGYFQYLAGNGKKGKEILNPKTKKYEVYNSQNQDHASRFKKNPRSLRTIWKPSSFQMALRTIPSSVKISQVTSPSKLTSAEQKILFISDIYEKTENDLLEVFQTGDINSLEKLYQAHHTNTRDQATALRMKKARQMFA